LLVDNVVRTAIADMKLKAEIAQSAVTVCICTFRRTTVVSTLQSVARQILPQGITRRIIVVDNDITPTAEPLVADFRSITGMDLDYLHAPGQNISIARNAGLEACRTRWLAFIDDDETAAVDWLDCLISNRDGAAAVFGPCEAIYHDDAPKWIKRGDYHSNRVVLRRGVIDTGYTSNVLIDMEFVHEHELQFDEEFGRTGGEDTMFFYAMHRCGGCLAYASDAIVYEEVSNARASLRWIVRRRYRAGQTYAKLQQKYNVRRFRQIPLLSPIKIAFCVGTAALLAIRPARGMWWLMRGVFHCGVLSYRLNGRVFEEYSRSEMQREKNGIQRLNA
jgi:succinoglycan biosynthesis protein ExoM